MTNPRPQLSPSDLERLFSAERLSTYIDHCDGNLAAAVEMYRWNSAITAAFWEPIGHLEVALRNTLACSTRPTSASQPAASAWKAAPPPCSSNSAPKAAPSTPS
jgi:hypothetical protein